MASDQKGLRALKRREFLRLAGGAAGFAVVGSLLSHTAMPLHLDRAQAAEAPSLDALIAAAVDVARN